VRRRMLNKNLLHSRQIHTQFLNHRIAPEKVRVT
jgi:hypothetical protein